MPAVLKSVAQVLLDPTHGKHENIELALKITYQKLTSEIKCPLNEHNESTATYR